jgi:hypothetical protein
MACNAMQATSLAQATDVFLSPAKNLYDRYAFHTPQKLDLTKTGFSEVIQNIRLIVVTIPFF